MTPEEWQRVRPILESALDLEPARRSSFLDGACADASLRREVESLIFSHEQAGTDVLSPGSLVGPPFEEEAGFRLMAGMRIGAYEILEEIAQGGMGAVYRAVRADGQYKQQVALKIVRADLGAGLTGTRFRNERQILASLDHPNIAKILDGGTTADGLPYFVMELIDGLPITEYCDKQKLPIDARLRIFRTVCSAVHYAHQHLVIHRDIKPSNILVTSEGVPKLLDFGIAKILDPGLLPKNLTATAPGLGMMTPEYASPEQLHGEIITTTTDVYSLGLVLYELLTGHHAYRFASRMPHEIARAVLETDPERPSAAIQRREKRSEERQETAPLTPELVSDLRADSPEKLCRRISGDLDNIVLKAIRKEPGARYSSADQLSEDIRRHLEGLPVLARKSTFAYRCRKYVLRHKVGVAAAALVFLSLLTGIALTLREARVARANELRAERRFNDVRKLANSLIFEVYDSIWQVPGATAARQLTIQRAQEYLDSLAQESASDPSLLRELAAAFSRLASVQGNSRDVNFGDSRKALENWRKSAALLESAASLQPLNRDIQRELARAYLNVALGLRQVGERSENEIYLRKAVQILEPLAAANPGDQEIQFALAKAYEQVANSARNEYGSVRALEFYRKAHAIYERLGVAQPENQQFQREISFSHKHLGSTLTEQNLLAEALEHERAALAIDEAQLARNPESVQDRYNITFTYNDTALILGKQGDLDGALAYYHKALDIRTALAAADLRDDRTREGLSNTLNYIGDALLQKKDYQAALNSYKKALAIRQTLSQKDPAAERLRFKRALTESDIGVVYAQMALRKTARPAEELKYCREAKAWIEPTWPIWMEMKTQRKLGEDAEAFVQIARNLEECSRVIARLDRTAKSPAH